MPEDMPGLAWTATHGGSLHVQALDGLAGDLSDEVEVLIEVQYRQSGQFGSCGDDQIRYRRSTMLAPISEQRQEFHRPVLDAFELGYSDDEKGLLVGPRKIGISPSNKLSERQRAAAKRIEKMLDQKVTFSFSNKSLAYVVMNLSLKTREIFILQPADRRAGLLDPNTSVSGSANQASLRQALESLLAPAKVSFVVRDEAVILTFKPRVPSGN